MDISVISSSATIVSPAVNTAFNQVLNDLLQLACLLVVSGIGWLVKLGINNLNSSWKKAIAMRFVSYAEQKISGDNEKLAWVSKEMTDHFPRLKQDEIQHHIEEAVVELKAKLQPTIIGS